MHLCRIRLYVLSVKSVHKVQNPHLNLLPLELEGRLARREWVRFLLVGPALDSVLVGVDLLAEAGDGNLQIGQ